MCLSDCVCVRVCLLPTSFVVAFRVVPELMVIEVARIAVNVQVEFLGGLRVCAREVDTDPGRRQVFTDLISLQNTK